MNFVSLLHLMDYLPKFSTIVPDAIVIENNAIHAHGEVTNPNQDNTLKDVINRDDVYVPRRECNVSPGRYSCRNLRS